MCLLNVSTYMYVYAMTGLSSNIYKFYKLIYAANNLDYTIFTDFHIICMPCDAIIWQEVSCTTLKINWDFINSYSHTHTHTHNRMTYLYVCFKTHTQTHTLISITNFNLSIAYVRCYVHDLWNLKQDFYFFRRIASILLGTPVSNKRYCTWRASLYLSHKYFYTLNSNHESVEIQYNYICV